ncbi:MAG: hypothetical protein OXG24_00730 [Gammaproteobacteria bacterium]|nr:hypothetical protein [Gammaproteobacteria bacterium]
MNRPLDTATATLEFFVGLVLNERDQHAIDLPSAKAKVAQTFGFREWQSIETISQRCCSVLDPSTVRFTRTLETGLHNAWQLITDQKHLSDWMFETKLELKVGGTFEFPTWKGIIGRLEHLSCIRFTAEAGGYSQFEIKQEGVRRTTVTITDYLPEGMLVPDHLTQGSDVFGMNQHGGPGTHWAGLLAGWHMGSDSLEAYASKRETSGEYIPLVRLYDALLVARNRD